MPTKPNPYAVTILSLVMVTGIMIYANIGARF